MSYEIGDTELLDFYASYSNVIVEEIRDMCKQKQMLLPGGDVPYAPECPDLDPELTLTLECMQDTFDPKWVTEAQLEEVELRHSVFENLQARLKNICFLTKSWALPVGTQCFQCKSKIESAYQYSWWAKCIEGDTFWCSKCYAVNEAIEENHKAVMNKTVSTAKISPVGETPVLKCNIKYNGSHVRYN